MEETGRLLKEERTRLGLTIQDVATSTKISVRVLRAIEDGYKDDLPQESFLKGFLKSYAVFLQMDPKIILDKYYEEQGIIPFSGRNDHKEGQQEGVTPIKGRSVVSKTIAVIGILALIGIIVSVKSVVEKYEKEGQVVAPPTHIKTIDSTKTNSDKGLLELSQSKSTLKKTITDPKATGDDSQKLAAVEKEKELGKKKNQDEGLAEAEAKKKLLAAQAKTDADKKAEEEKIKKLALENAEAKKKAAEEKAKLKALAESKAKKKAEAIDLTKPEKVINRKTKLYKQEIIIEALDKVSILFEIDGGPKQKLNLDPDQTHTLKGTKTLSLDVSDGGAVNVIYNGRDKGVPGELGQPKKLKFP